MKQERYLQQKLTLYIDLQGKCNNLAASMLELIKLDLLGKVVVRCNNNSIPQLDEVLSTIRKNVDKPNVVVETEYSYLDRISKLKNADVIREIKLTNTDEDVKLKEVRSFMERMRVKVSMDALKGQIVLYLSQKNPKEVEIFFRQDKDSTFTFRYNNNVVAAM